MGGPMGRKRKTPKTTRLERTAYHEAGHAVAAFELRRAFRHISIEPREESLGHVLYAQWSKHFQPDQDSSARTRNEVERAVICAFAGYVAETRFSGRHNRKGAHEDMRHAEELASFMHEGEVLDRYQDYLMAKTEQMITQPLLWAAVKALAEALLREKRIGYRKARRIIQQDM